MYVCVGVYLLVGWKGKLSEPLRQIVHSSNTNNVKFLSCHKNKDTDSAMNFSEMIQYFTNGSEQFGTLLVKMLKQCHKQYLTILTFKIFTHALMLLGS